MTTPRKLNNQQEKTVALVYLCGGKAIVSYLAEKYSVSAQTITTNIIGKRSMQWNNDIIEFYRQLENYGSASKAAHLYVCFHKQDTELPSANLIGWEEEEAYTVLCQTIFRQAEEVSDFVKPFVQPSNGYDRLLRALTEEKPKKSPWEERRYKQHREEIGCFAPYADAAQKAVEERIVERLEQAYGITPLHQSTIDSICYKVKDEMVALIRTGACTMTPLKKSVIDEFIRGLDEKQQQVIFLRYGIENRIYSSIENRTYTLEEIGRLLEPAVSRDWVRQIQVKALKRIKEHANFEMLRQLAQPITDEQLKGALDQKKYEKEKEKWTTILYPEFLASVRPDEAPEAATTALRKKYMIRAENFEFSVRTANCLRNADIKTICELVQRTETDMLKVKNFGMRSLEEIKGILAEIGLSLKIV